MQWFSTIVLAMTAYLLGSVPTGLWVARLVHHTDIRTVGSGNTGATNVARSVGLKWGLLVLTLDMAKGALPVTVALCVLPTGGEGYFLKIALVALAAFFGHLFSIFLNFRGGKGVATALGITLVLFPLAALPTLLVFFIVTWRWRYVSLGSVTAGLTLPIWARITGCDPLYVGLSTVFALCIVVRHRSNLRALLKGKERRL